MRRTARSKAQKRWIVRAVSLGWWDFGCFKKVICRWELLLWSPEFAKKNDIRRSSFRRTRLLVSRSWSSLVMSLMVNPNVFLDLDGGASDSLKFGSVRIKT
jgi:hypothetical protein